MEGTQAGDARILARDRALSLLNNITAYVAFAAVAGVGILGTVSALTIPGVAASSSSSATASATTSTPPDSSSTSSSSSVLAPSSASVSSSSSSGVAVSGGS